MSVPERLVLAGVPRVHFFEGGDECPEDIFFPSCLRAWLHYMGDGYGCKLAPAEAGEWRPECAYAYFVGLTGLGFWMGWNSARGEGGTTDPLMMAEDPAEPFRRALTAVGYEHEVLLKPEFVQSITGQRPAGRLDEADLRARIIASINAGRPVIGFGVVGPPETCLITGYDESGEVLIGWSFFQKLPEFSEGLEFEPSGEFRKRHWYADTAGVVLIGERGAKPPAAETYRRALEWAVQVMRTPKVHSMTSGLAAYRAWIDMLSEASNFDGVDDATLATRYQYHDFLVGNTAEARWYGSLFLRQVASQLPAMAEDLNAAADCFEAQHDLMWGVWEFAKHGEPSEHPKRLTNGWVRERLTCLVRLGLREDERAAGYLEQALRKV